MTKTTQCPKCNAELPSKGRFCLECGFDLYAEGVRRPPSPWPRILIVALIAAAIIIYCATRPRSPELPPEERLVRQHTTELLRLVERGEYREIVQRFYEPDKEPVERTGDLLREIIRGRGAPGLNVFRVKAMGDLEEAATFVARYRPDHPEYIVRVLAAITFQDGALRTSLGGVAFGAERTELFLAWYLEQAFAGVDASQAEVVDVRWSDDPSAERLLIATVRYPGAAQPIPGVAAPTHLPWRRIGDDTWALAFGQSFLLEEVLDFLQRVKL